MGPGLTGQPDSQDSLRGPSPVIPQGKEGKPIPSQSPRNSHGCGYLEHAGKDCAATSRLGGKE